MTASPPSLASLRQLGILVREERAAWNAEPHNGTRWDVAIDAVTDFYDNSTELREHSDVILALLDRVERAEAVIEAHVRGWTLDHDSDAWYDTGIEPSPLVCLDENLVTLIASLRVAGSPSTEEQG